MTTKHSVVEIFGPTMQGEGALAGTISHFVRFGGCDFRCAWCDSAPAVLPELVRNAPRLSNEEIADKLIRLPGSAPWVTLSGGNPALHALGGLVQLLHECGYKVAVETQGSFWRDWLGTVDLLTLSPKPPSSGMEESFEAFQRFMQSAHNYYQRGLPDGEYYALQGRLVMKVPVLHEDDIEWAAELHERYPHLPFYVSIVTKMGGLHGDFAEGEIDGEAELLDRYSWVVKEVLKNSKMSDVRILPQLHVLVWGHERGH